MAFPSDEKLTDLINPVVESFGMDLEGVKVARAGKKSTVTVFVDADVRPTSDTLEAVTQEISSLFDAREAEGEVNFGPGYLLDVGTPGIDAPLRLPRHWRRNQGRLVTLVDEAKKRTARIGKLSDDETHVMTVVRAGKDLVFVPIRLADYPTAMVEIEFSPPPVEELEMAATDYNDASTQVSSERTT